MSAAVAFGAGSALVAPMAGAQSSSLPGSSAPDTCGESIVTPSGLAAAGWSTPSDETRATIAAVTGAPPEVGPAALVFGAQDPAKPGVSMYKDAGGMKLAELLGEDEELLLNFDYSTNGQAPALQIRLLNANVKGNAGETNGFATITWSPEAGTGNWQSADASESNEFWVTRPVVDPANTDNVLLERGSRTTLARIIELNSNATVTGVGVQKTEENAAQNVAIDNFVFGCETDNFELDPAGGSLGNVFGSVTGIFQS